MNVKPKLSVGSDPEVFLRNTKGELVSAIGIIPGNKNEPFKTEHGSVQPDNVLAEFNSMPARSADEFVRNHKFILQDLNEILKPLDLRTDFIASALCTQEMLEHPYSRMAGCDPDYDAWTLTRNMPPDYAFNDLRAAGGHLHIAFSHCEVDDDELAAEIRVNFVKALDLVLGVPSVIVDRDTERRKFYGKAGAHRPKWVKEGDPYNGVEYRTLSNFWLKSEELMRFAWYGVEHVFRNLRGISETAKSFEKDIVEIINTGNAERAFELCGGLNIYVPEH